MKNNIIKNKISPELSEEIKNKLESFQLLEKDKIFLQKNNDLANYYTFETESILQAYKKNPQMFPFKQRFTTKFNKKKIFQYNIYPLTEEIFFKEDKDQDHLTSKDIIFNPETIQNLDKSFWNPWIICHEKKHFNSFLIICNNIIKITTMLYTALNTLQEEEKKKMLALSIIYLFFLETIIPPNTDLLKNNKDIKTVILYTREKIFKFLWTDKTITFIGILEIFAYSKNFMQNNIFKDEFAWYKKNIPNNPKFIDRFKMFADYRYFDFSRRIPRYIKELKFYKPKKDFDLNQENVKKDSDLQKHEIVILVKKHLGGVKGNLFPIKMYTDFPLKTRPLEYNTRNTFLAVYTKKLHAFHKFDIVFNINPEDHVYIFEPYKYILDHSLSNKKDNKNDFCFNLTTVLWHIVSITTLCSFYTKFETKKLQLLKLTKKYNLEEKTDLITFCINHYIGCYYLFAKIKYDINSNTIQEQQFNETEIEEILNNIETKLINWWVYEKFDVRFIMKKFISSLEEFKTLHVNSKKTIIHFTPDLTRPCFFYNYCLLLEQEYLNNNLK